MIDERREAQASLYVLGALPWEEQREFEAALRAELPVRRLVKELRGTASAMVAAFPRINPPPVLKEKILAAVDERGPASARVLALDPTRTPPWMAWMPWALAACFALLCIVLISLGHRLRQQAVALSEQLGERNDEAADLKKQMELLQAQLAEQATNFQQRALTLERDAIKRIEDLNRQTTAFTNQFQKQQAEIQKQLVFYRDRAEQLARDNKALEDALATAAGGAAPGNNRLANARITVLRPSDPQSRAIGAALWSPQDQRGLLALENLAPLPPNQSYQLWLIDPRKTPISAGVLPADATGSLRLQFNPDIKVDAVERIAVSIEPKGGSPMPTGRIVLLGS
jgi:anti-sigma-K factor RskA